MYYQQIAVSNIVQEYQTNEDSSNVIDAIVAEKTSNIMYGQVLVQPSVIELGVITNDIQRTAELWNATTESLTLNSTTETGFDGIVLTGTKTGEMLANTSNVYQLDIAGEGGSAINALITFNFDDYTPNVVITGTRTILFAYYPDFKNGLTTNFNYSTLINTFYNGDEERYQNILNAKMSINNNYIENKKNSRTIQNILNVAGSKKILVPDFSLTHNLISEINVSDNQIELNDTFNFEIGQFLFVGDFNSKYFLSKIIAIDSVNNIITLEDSFNNSFSTKYKVFPVYECQVPESTSINFETDDIISTSLSFSIIDNTIETLKENTNVVFSTFNGKIFLDKRPNFVGISNGNKYLIEDLNNGFGVNERIVRRVEADNNFSYSFICANIEDINYFKEFFRQNKGRKGEFYVPSYFNNIQVVQNITASQTSFLIENNNNFSLNSGYKNRKYVYIETINGDVFLKEILSFSIDGYNEIMTIDSNLGIDLSINEIKRMEYVYSVRLDSDVLAVNYQTDQIAYIDLTFKTIGESA